MIDVLCVGRHRSEQLLAVRINVRSPGQSQFPLNVAGDHKRTGKSPRLLQTGPRSLSFRRHFLWTVSTDHTTQIRHAVPTVCDLPTLHSDRSTIRWSGN